MISVNAMGDACPIPVVKTKNAIRELNGPGIVETLVDNEIAVQNLSKMAAQKGYGVKSEKLGEGSFKVTMIVGEGAAMPDVVENETCPVTAGNGRRVVVVIASASMGEGSEELGGVLMKGFIYALSQQDALPAAILLYNGGVRLAVEGSASLEDLKSLEAQGVEILSCGTCLNFYGLTDKLAVGEVTNMYTIVEKMTDADLVVKP